MINMKILVNFSLLLVYVYCYDFHMQRHDEKDMTKIIETCFESFDLSTYEKFTETCGKNFHEYTIKECLDNEKKSLRQKTGLLDDTAKVFINVCKAYQGCKESLRPETITDLLSCSKNTESTLMLSGNIVRCIENIKTGDKGLRASYVEYIRALGRMLKKQDVEPQDQKDCSFLWNEHGIYEKLKSLIASKRENENSEFCLDFDSLMKKLDEELEKCTSLKESKKFIIYEIKKLSNYFCTLKTPKCNQDTFEHCITDINNSKKIKNYEDICLPTSSQNKRMECIKKSLKECPNEFIVDTWTNFFKSHDEACKQLESCQQKSLSKSFNISECRSNVWQTLSTSKGYPICGILTNVVELQGALDDDEDSLIKNIQKNMCRYPNYLKQVCPSNYITDIVNPLKNCFHTGMEKLFSIHKDLEVDQKVQCKLMLSTGNCMAEASKTCKSVFDIRMIENDKYMEKCSQSSEIKFDCESRFDSFKRNRNILIETVDSMNNRENVTQLAIFCNDFRELWHEKNTLTKNCQATIIKENDIKLEDKLSKLLFCLHTNSASSVMISYLVVGLAAISVFLGLIH